MKSRMISIRFNPGKAADRQAYDYLKRSGTSYSKTVINALNAQLCQQGEEQRQESFLEALRQIIHDELQAVSATPVTQEPPVSQEDEDAMLAFLDAFDGGM